MFKIDPITLYLWKRRARPIAIGTGALAMAIGATLMMSASRTTPPVLATVDETGFLQADVGSSGTVAARLPDGRRVMVSRPMTGGKLAVGADICLRMTSGAEAIELRADACAGVTPGG